jgi:hypothetical protein
MTNVFLDIGVSDYVEVLDVIVAASTEGCFPSKLSYRNGGIRGSSGLVPKFCSDENFGASPSGNTTFVVVYRPHIYWLLAGELTNH